MNDVVVPAGFFRLEDGEMAFKGLPNRARDDGLVAVDDSLDKVVD